MYPQEGSNLDIHQNHNTTDLICLMLNYMYSLCTNPFSQTHQNIHHSGYYFTTYRPQLFLLNGYFVARKHSELNHHDRAQINRMIE